MKIYEVRVRRALAPSALPEYDYSLNPYLGCLHGCLYCYAMDMTRGPPGALWGRVVYVKVNLLEVLRREAARLKPGVVGMSTITDPYQPPEARYRLARGALEILAEAGFHISIQTKSGLVVRDLDLLARYRHRVDVGVTITTMRDKARILEPLAAHPLARIRAVEKIAAAGVRTWVFLGPVIPGFNDDPSDLREVVEAAHAAGAEVVYDRYRPKPRADATLAARWRKVVEAPGWWTRTKKTIEQICSEVGARCIGADEEWREALLKKKSL